MIREVLPKESRWSRIIKSIGSFFKRNMVPYVSEETKKKKKEFIERELEKRRVTIEHKLKEKPGVIEDCNKRLSNIEENLKIFEYLHIEENRIKISVELIKAKRIGIDFNDFDLIKRVDEIQNELCSQNIKRFAS